MDLRDGNAQAAKQRYEALLAKDPKQESAVLALADVLQKSGSAVSEIEKVLDRGIASNPGATRLRTAKVQAAINRGDAKAAITAAQEAQAAFPEQPAVIAALGRAQLLSGEFSQAVATFSKLAQLMPASAVPLLALADAAGAARDWSAARQAIQKAIQLQPDSMPARRGLVEVELQAGRADEAHAAALAIQKQWPNGAAGYLAEAHVLINQKKERQAEQVLRTAMRKTGNSALALRLFTMLQAQGRTKDAATLAADWLARNPNDFLVADYVGDANLRTKDYAAAAQWYTEALKIRPNNATLLNNLAWAFGQLRDAKALEYGRKALSLEPTNPAILDTVGWLYVEAGDLNQGLELLGKATALAPNAAPIKLNYARALVKAGQNTVARPQLESLTKLPPESAVRQEAEKILSTL
jgi:putative PEP-CTERM system TPR-repeat lipoprotein